MLWHKRTTHKFPLVVFGLVALGIIISGTILLVELFKEKEIIEQVNTTLPKKENYLEIEYFLQIEKLVTIVNEAVSVDDVITSTKNTLLSVRVPAEMRDPHLNVFLEIIKLEDVRDDLTLEETKEKIVGLLKNILASKSE